jgi:hypothetical protein
MTTLAPGRRRQKVLLSAPRSHEKTACAVADRRDRKFVTGESTGLGQFQEIAVRVSVRAVEP